MRIAPAMWLGLALAALLSVAALLWRAASHKPAQLQAGLYGPVRLAGNGDDTPWAAPLKPAPPKTMPEPPRLRAMPPPSTSDEQGPQPPPAPVQLMAYA